MNPDPSPGPLSRTPRRAGLRGWTIVVLVLAVTVSASVWYRSWRRPASPSPPPIDFAGIDPEVAAFLQEARDAVVRAPRSAESWGFLGRSLHAHNYLPEALVCYAEAERLDPASADWPFLRAEILAAGPEPAEAIPSLRSAIARDGGNPLPRLRLGEILLDQGDADEAAEQFRAVLDFDPGEPRAHLRLAQLAASRQDWRECLRHLETAAAAPSARKQACALRWRAYDALGDGAAVQTQQRLLAELPEDPPWPNARVDRELSLSLGLPARINLAGKLRDEQRDPEALTLLEDTVRKYPDSGIAWDHLGRLRGALRRFPESEQALQRSVELVPQSGDAWYFLGLSRLAQDKLDDALVALRRAAELRPANAQIHCKIAACLASKGDRAGAEHAYQEALRYQPDCAEARDELAKLRSKTQK